MSQSNFQIHSLTMPIVVVAFLLLGVFAAVQIGTENFFPLLLVVGGVFSLLYVIYFSRFTWQIALLLCYTGLSFRPTGFEVGSAQLSCALAAALAATMFWQKRPVERAGILEHRSFALLRLLLFLWIVYVAIHMIYNISNPLRPTDFMLKNALKSYFIAFVPFVMLWYFSGNPHGIQTNSKVMRTIAILMLAGVTFNVVVSCVGIIDHTTILDPDDDSGYAGTLFIPGINAKDNPYILRPLGPTAVLFGATLLTLGRQATGVPAMLSTCLLAFGSVGALLSGGRAAIVIAIAYVLAMLFATRRILALCLISVAAGAFILVVNLASDWVNHEAPLAISRPLQLVMFNKDKMAFSSIESSSRWRKELFSKAIGEWQSNPRIFWFGRATYGFGVSDLVAQDISGGYIARMESSLRRGKTHNLITDLLIAYGLVGCILYYALLLNIIGFLWKVYNSVDVPQVAKPLALICLISSAVFLAVASVGGTFYPTDMIWLLIILVAMLYRHQIKKISQAPATPAVDLVPSHESRFSR